MNDIVVSICCITYNQEKYIAKTLDGFINQKVNFKYEIVISNDCSTDKTQEIINIYKKKYSDLIRDISPEKNIGAIENFYYCLKSCKGKYIAICEGDDYWIDENKLQLQVSLLENNPEYGMCYTKARKFIQYKQKYSRKLFGEKVNSFEDLLLNGNRIPTLTVCMCSSLVKQYMLDIKPEEKEWMMGDYPLWLYFAKNTNIYFINKVTSVYRLLIESASHTKNINNAVKFLKSSFEIQKYFAEKYNVKFSRTFNENEIKISYGLLKCCREAVLNTESKNINNKYKFIQFTAKSRILFYLIYTIRKIYYYFLNLNFGIMKKRKSNE